MIKRVARLFDKVQNDSEVVKWIRKFSASNRNFAVLKISGASLSKFPEDICEDLAILSKLDLDVPVIYGWGNDLTRKLKDNGLDTVMHHSGVRVTRECDLPYLNEIAEEHGNIIIDGLNKRGIPAKIVKGIFKAEMKQLDGVDYKHYTGEITSTKTDVILDYLSKSIIPVIPPIGFSESGEIMNINADSAAKELVLKLMPEKYIILTNTNGVLDTSEKVISEISVSEDYQRLVEEKIVNEGMKLKIDEAKEIIEEVSSKRKEIAVQIANPTDILSELFTDAGRGTYIRQ